MTNKIRKLAPFLAPLLGFTVIDFSHEATPPDRGVPMGLASDGKGRLWIGDFSKNHLYRVTLKSGDIELVASDGLARPENIAFRKR
jgi:hypothetical protein